MDNRDFKVWLAQRKKLSERTVNDIISRLNRGAAIVPGFEKKRADEIIMLLNREEEFQKISSTVKSQIRRAFRLREEYQNSNTH